MSEVQAALDLGLTGEQRAQLRNEIDGSAEYKETKEKMRAAVLLCTQELINGLKTSHFEQFHRGLPQEIPNAAAAIAAAVSFLQSKGLVHTLSVLYDELDPETIEHGKGELAELLQGVPPGPDTLAQLVAAGRK
jgi:hypothetical protein